MLEEMVGYPIPVRAKDRRSGDQPLYYIDIYLAHQELGWFSRMDVRQGVYKLWDWVKDNLALFTF